MINPLKPATVRFKKASLHVGEICLPALAGGTALRSLFPTVNLVAKPSIHFWCLYWPRGAVDQMLTDRLRRERRSLPL
jgi:hypothetical protein